MNNCNKYTILSIAHLSDNMAMASHPLTYLCILDTSSIILQVILHCWTLKPVIMACYYPEAANFMGNCMMVTVVVLSLLSSGSV